MLRALFAFARLSFAFVLIAAESGRAQEPDTDILVGAEVELLNRPLRAIIDAFDFSRVETTLLSEEMSKDYLQNEAAFRALPPAVQAELSKDLTVWPPKPVITPESRIVSRQGAMVEAPKHTSPVKPLPKGMTTTESGLIVPAHHTEGPGGLHLLPSSEEASRLGPLPPIAQAVDRRGSIYVPKTEEDPVRSAYEQSADFVELNRRWNKRYLEYRHLIKGPRLSAQNRADLLIASPDSFKLKPGAAPYLAGYKWKKDRDTVEFVHTDPLRSIPELIASVRGLAKAARVWDTLNEPAKSDYRDSSLHIHVSIPGLPAHVSLAPIAREFNRLFALRGPAALDPRHIFLERARMRSAPSN